MKTHTYVYAKAPRIRDGAHIRELATARSDVQGRLPRISQDQGAPYTAFTAPQLQARQALLFNRSWLQLSSIMELMQC